MIKNRIIKDCIHGFIVVPKLCELFIDQPEFQRLRRIKQLGNVHRVFPSANHTRFEHSIGVMHLAGVVGKHLKIKGRLLELIQLAGLYHDIGHLPYSHLFDKALEIIKPEGVLRHHEDRSIQTLHKVCNRLCSASMNLLTDKEIEFVSACIKGIPLNGYPRHYFQIVASYVDVDKMDYLIRDAYHTGMPNFQIEYIIHNMTIDQEGNMAFNRKAMGDIKNIFETRQKMHDLVYQHAVCLEYDTMYICMILRLKDVIDYNELCDCKLESMLMSHPKTKLIYEQIEQRHKMHHTLCCDSSHPIITKHIPVSGEIDQIKFCP